MCTSLNQPRTVIKTCFIFQGMAERGHRLTHDTSIAYGHRHHHIYFPKITPKVVPACLNVIGSEVSPILALNAARCTKYAPKVLATGIAEVDVAPIARNTQLFPEEVEQGLAIPLVERRVDVVQAHLQYSRSYLYNRLPLRRGLTMRSKKAGSNVPAKVRLGLYFTLMEMYFSGFERISAANCRCFNL